MVLSWRDEGREARAGKTQAVATWEEGLGRVGIERVQSSCVGRAEREDATGRLAEARGGDGRRQQLRQPEQRKPGRERGSGLSPGLEYKIKQSHGGAIAAIRAALLGGGEWDHDGDAWGRAEF
jgi:hypothetical protein